MVHPGLWWRLLPGADFLNPIGHRSHASKNPLFNAPAPRPSLPRWSGVFALDRQARTLRARRAGDRPCRLQASPFRCPLYTGTITCRRLSNAGDGYHLAKDVFPDSRLLTLVAPKQFQFPDDLKKVIQGKRCAAFIGSGPSTGCYHSWPDLVNALCERCGATSRVTRDSPSIALLDAAQDAKDSDAGAYHSYLGEHFGRPASQTALVYDALFSLPFDCYLTVNFDPLLALQCRTAKLTCDTNVKHYPSLDRKMARRSIHYLHGLIREGSIPLPGSIVLSRDEFETAYADNSNLMNFLVSTLENDPIIFIGCRLQEPVMGRVFQICKTHQQTRLTLAGPSSKPPTRFILLPEEYQIDAVGAKSNRNPKDVEEERVFYESMDIRPIWYPADGHDHSALRYAIEALAGLSEITPNYGWEEGGYEQ